MTPAEEFLNRTVNHREQTAFISTGNYGIYHTDPDCGSFPTHYEIVKEADISDDRTKCWYCMTQKERGVCPLPNVPDGITAVYVSAGSKHAYHTDETCHRLMSAYDIVNPTADREVLRGRVECACCLDSRQTTTRTWADLPTDLRELNGSYNVTSEHEFRCKVDGCGARCTRNPVSHIEYGHRKGCPHRPDHFPKSGRGKSYHPQTATSD